MARARKTVTPRTSDGKAICNAALNLFEADGVTPAVAVFTAASGGSAVTSVVTASDSGSVTLYSDSEKYVEIEVTDNSNTATFAGLSGVKSFPSYRMPNVELDAPPDEVMQLDGTQTVSGAKTFSGDNTYTAANVFTGSLEVPEHATATRPAASTAGRLSRLTDGIRGWWRDTALRWVGLVNVVNVADFGALGDAVTDDTVAIQAAIDAASAATYGGTVEFPPGRYVISASLIIPSVCHLKGTGGGTSVTSFNTPPGARLAGGTTANVLSFIGSDRCRIENLYVQGAPAMRVVRGHNIDIVNCQIQSMATATPALDVQNSFWIHPTRTTFYAFDVTSPSVRIVTSTPARVVTDGVTTSGSNVITSATANFTANTDIYAAISGTGIPANTRITSITNSTTAVMDKPATATATGVTLTLAGTQNGWTMRLDHCYFDKCAVKWELSGANWTSIMGDMAFNYCHTENADSPILHIASTHSGTAAGIRRLAFRDCWHYDQVSGHIGNSILAVESSAQQLNLQTLLLENCSTGGSASMIDIRGTVANVRTFSCLILGDEDVASGTGWTNGSFVSLMDHGWRYDAYQSTAAQMTGRVTGDAAPRWQRDAAGKDEWGDGTSAVDTNQYRSAAGNLKTDGSYNAKRFLVPAGTTLVAADFALSASWGDGASIAFVGTPKDQRYIISITANGAGIAASPTFTHTFKDGAFGNPVAVVTPYGSGALTTARVVQSIGATSLQILFNGTPVAGTTYSFAVMVMG